MKIEITPTREVLFEKGSKHCIVSACLNDSDNNLLKMFLNNIDRQKLKRHYIINYSQDMLFINCGEQLLYDELYNLCTIIYSTKRKLWSLSLSKNDEIVIKCLNTTDYELRYVKSTIGSSRTYDVFDCVDCFVCRIRIKM